MEPNTDPIYLTLYMEGIQYNRAMDFRSKPLKYQTEFNKILKEAQKMTPLSRTGTVRIQCKEVRQKQLIMKCNNFGGKPVKVTEPYFVTRQKQSHEIQETHKQLLTNH